MINTIKHLVYLLRTSKAELLYILNNIDKYYYDKKQPKIKYGQPQKDGEEILYRYLTPSRFPLKKIQQRINLLLQGIELPEYAYGGVRNSNNILNAKRHIENKYFFSADLKNFFPNITHHQVFRMFMHNKFSPTVARILTQLTTYRGGLPQGAPTSPIISNLVFVETGNKLFERTKHLYITVTTFYDDLTFSSKDDFKIIIPDLLEIIKTGKFFLHYKKLKYKTRQPEVTGVVIDKNKLWPVASMKKRAEKNIFIARYIKSIASY
jgi:RNA-directed DNA polymerase